MTTRTIITIFFKDMRDTLRDRRTLVAMLGVPIILYPLLFIVASQTAIIQSERIEQMPSRVAIIGDTAGIVAHWIKAIPKVTIVDTDQPDSDLVAGRLDAIVKVGPGARAMLEEGGSVAIAIEYDAAETTSNTAVTRLTEELNKLAMDIRKDRLERAGLDLDYAEPIDIMKENVATRGKITGSILGAILPLIMVLMVGVGAFYPAIDLTAGEKERGTFETLLSTPTTKFEILCGKFFTVFALSMLTGVLNLASMMITLIIQLAHLPADFDGVFELHLPLQTVLLMLLALAPLSFFISAIMMSIAVFAKDFKEAQNYITPFFLLIIFPAAMAAIPGIKLGPATQFIPIGNVALLFKALMMGPVSIHAAFAVLLSTGAYALLALLFAGWIFRQEEVVLAEDHGLPLTFRRSELPVHDRPTIGLALFLYAACLLLLFHLGSFLQSRSLSIGLLITLWGLVLLPSILVCWFFRIRMVPAFNLRMPRLCDTIGAVLLCGGWVVLLLQISAWHGRVLPMPEELGVEMDAAIAGIKAQWGFWGLLFIVALSPAICEEALFRGPLLSGLRGKLPAWAGIAVIAFLFALFHLSIHRMVPTFLSGVVLTYLVWRSGSILLGVLGHFIINGAVLTLFFGQIPGISERILAPIEAGESMPIPFLIGAVACVAGGIALTRLREQQGGASGPPHTPTQSHQEENQHAS